MPSHLVASVLLALAQVTLDPIAHDAPPTGAICTTGPARCQAHVQTTEHGLVRTFAAPMGLVPADIQAAYDIPTSGPDAPTIAIIDAFGYPELESDLATYRSTFGLPPCTTANGCLRVVNQSGAPSPLPAPPPADDDWTLETALDVDAASAACPRCKLLVVEAENALDGLYIANATAATLGATVISNSWGGAEVAGQSLANLEPYFDHPGIAVFASSGDKGYNYGGEGPLYPATSSHVIAVGGTRLVRDTSPRGWTETSWTSSGSACSLSIPRPAYQAGSPCAFKASADISAVGDPATGLAVFNARNNGWVVVGGTSASSPIVAAIFAATGNGARDATFIAQNATKLNDVLAGQNGTCGNVLCNAGKGWDGPTGFGTPDAKRLGGTGTGGGGGGGGSGSGAGSGDDRAADDVVGGCTATGASASTWLVLALAALVRRRRG